MKNFIEQQQELLVTSELLIEIEDIAINPLVLEKKLDTLITQIITNTGKELMRLAEWERKEMSVAYYSKETNQENMIFNQAIHTMKQHITNVTGAV